MEFARGMFPFLCAFAAAVAVFAGEPVFPETTLIERMCEAIEGKTVTNAVPAETMMRLAPGRSEKEFNEVWKFDPGRIDKMLAASLVCGEDGRYRLKHAVGGLPRDASGLVTPEASVRYVNKVFADWAVGELDRSFERASSNLVKRVLDGSMVEKDSGVDPSLPVLSEKGSYRVPGVGDDAPWTAMWRVDGEYFLFMTPARGDPLARRRYYFVLWDGYKDWPVAHFDSFPTPRRAWSVLRILVSPAACNDISVYLDWRKANRTCHDPEYISVMIREALMRGEEAAAWNLGLLLERKGEAEVSKLMKERGAKAFAK